MALDVVNPRRLELETTKEILAGVLIVCSTSRKDRRTKDLLRHMLRIDLLYEESPHGFWSTRRSLEL